MTRAAGGVVWAVMGQHFTFYFLSGDVLSFNTRPYLDTSDWQTEAVCPGDWRFDSQNSDIIIAIIMSPGLHSYILLWIVITLDILC